MSAQTIEVAPGEGDQRLDRWLKRHFPHVNQGRVEKACRTGEIRVEGGRVKASTRLEVGQHIRVPPLPEVEPKEKEAIPRVSPADAAMIQACVLYRDDDMIVLNKPPGLASQGGSGTTKHVDGLAEALKFGQGEKPRLVHRLDKDTSGILVLARSREAAAALTAAFRSRATRKIYWGVVAGVPHPYKGSIKYGLVKAPGHGPSGEGEKMRCIHPSEVEKIPDAKRAHTDYAVLSALGRRAAWVALEPVTGRTHQLRAHMAEMGHPIIGDGKYGGSGQENEGDGWGSQLGGDVSRKMHLHARSLFLDHPMTGKHLQFFAPLPEHMARTWETFGWSVDEFVPDPFGDPD